MALALRVTLALAVGLARAADALAAAGDGDAPLAVRAEFGVARIDAIPGAVLVESATDLWRAPEAALEADAPRELREVPGATAVVRGIGDWTRPAGSTRIAWADGAELRVLDAARDGPPATVAAGRVTGRVLRATPSADAASFLLETARPFAVDHEELRPMLLERGQAREASPPIRVREGLDVHWVPGARLFSVSSFEAGAVWSWAPGSPQPVSRYRADPAEPLAESFAGPGDAEITLLLESEATGRLRALALPLRSGARAREPVALPPGVWERCRWSPDGSLLAGLRRVDGRTRVGVVGSDGGLASEWTPPEREDVAGIAWASDGRRLWIGTRAGLRVWRPSALR